MHHRLYLGCAVWAYKDWVGEFYPPKSRPQDFLRLYSQRLSAVEGNTTFYSVPDKATLQRWRTATNSGFQFCLKLPRQITHDGLLMPHWPTALQFLNQMQELGDRLGPFFAQLPPSYGPAQFEDLRAFLHQWPEDLGRLAVEVRHLGWFKPPFQDRLNQLLRDRGAGRVLLDTRPIYDCIDAGGDDPQRDSQRRKPRVPLQPILTTNFTLVRYIGHPSIAVNQPYLNSWVPRIAEWLTRGTQVYAFFHCPAEVCSPSIAWSFYQTLKHDSRLPDLPDLSWTQSAQANKPAKQLSLFE
ncbi:MAG: DUF72 domain-containing protein [Cyanobacteria bacterium P01_H01_bin.119]